MSGRYLVGSNKKPPEANIYADKSAMVLHWLLTKESNEEFSLREAARKTGVSLGLVQRVFEVLVSKGILNTKGVRTAKKFFFKNPRMLLENWLEHYSLTNKCKVWTYCTGYQGRKELLQALKKSRLGEKLALALHSAAEAHGYKNTNLETLELYLLDSSSRQKLEKEFLLEPQEKGYEVLLIEPHYKSLLGQSTDSYENVKVSSPLLTFLDLYHFPLRGREQAEFMLERIPSLKKIYTDRASKFEISDEPKPRA